MSIDPIFWLIAAVGFLFLEGMTFNMTSIWFAAGSAAALLACRLPAYEAAACAVYLHGAAADRAAAELGEYGMLPHDILPELGRMFAENNR